MLSRCRNDWVLRRAQLSERGGSRMRAHFAMKESWLAADESDERSGVVWCEALGRYGRIAAQRGRESRKRAAPPSSRPSRCSSARHPLAKGRRYESVLGGGELLLPAHWLCWPAAMFVSGAAKSRPRSSLHDDVV